MATNSARSTKTTSSQKPPELKRMSSFVTSEGLNVKKIQVSNIKHVKPPIKTPRPPPVREIKTKDTTSVKDIKEQEAKFEKLLAGCLDDLPNLPHSTVRIFVSSTFSDMRAERNAMVKDVIPLLKEDCARDDLDFQMVDMRWGVTEDSQNDHSVEKICLLEVENCQKISLGPNFILLSGDRYGFRPIPVDISMEEFDVIKKFAKEQSLPDAKLLDVWYLLDENAKPPQNVLQPVRSQFTYYGDYSPGWEQSREKDTLGWDNAFRSLQGVLRQAATAAFKAKKLTEKRLHDYFLSVTEIEVEKGILTAPKPELHTSVYHRVLRGLDGHNIKDPTAKRYFDTTTKDGKTVIDEEAKALRENVVTKKVPVVMKNSKRIHQYQPYWYEGGVDPSKHLDHKDYIRNFCYDLIQDITDLIDKARKDQKNLIRNTEYYTDYQEVLHHMHFCNMKCETFCGRDDVLDKAKEYVLNDKSRRPLVLYAPSGAGKTSVMAKIMQKLPDWFKNQPYLGVIQFLGTSPLSINIYDVLRGTCGQLADCAQILMEPVGYKTMKNLISYLPRFLRRVSSKVKKPIVILLDSLDQLLPDNDAHLCKWLPTMLPANVRIIVSTLPEEFEILDTLQKLFPDTSNFVEVPALPDEAGFEMIDKYMARKERTVTQYQTRMIVNAFRKCRGALYLKLVLDEAVTWKSYTPEHEVVLQDTVQGAINQLFDNMEKKFGTILISHALGYITVALNGITDIEWEDVLSCDDEVLDDIYRYHNPPVPGIVRMPPVLVARIRYDLREYIVERRSFGKTTLSWYHRQFIQTAHARYAVGSAGKKLHKVLAEYFTANNGIHRDITLHRRKLTVEKADRQVTKQPLVVKNKRKLSAMPYHIIHAGDQIDPSKAKSDCFCNLDYLRVIIAAFPVSTLIEDLTKYLEKNEDEEVAFLRNYFLLTKVEMGASATNLAINLLSRLLVDDSHTHLKELLQQAKNVVHSSPSPLLIPVFPCLAPRKDTSSALVKMYNDVETVIAEGMESVLMANVKDDEESSAQLSVYDAVNSELYSLVPNNGFNPVTTPLLDQTEKRVIQFGKDRLKTVHFHNQAANEKKFLDICKEIEAQSYPIVSTLSTDSMHITVLFNNGDVLTFDTNSFQKVDIFTIREEPKDVANIITTSAENLKVILTIDNDLTLKENETGGCVRVHVLGSEEEGKLLRIPLPFDKGLAAVGFNETILVGCSNKEDEGILKIIDLENVKCTYTEDCKKLKQLSVSHSHGLAAIWPEGGSIALYDTSVGEVIKELDIESEVTSFGISWINDLAFIGDNKGKITMYRGQTGKHFGDFTADSDEIVKIAVLEDQVVTLSGKHTIRVWQIPVLLNAEEEKARIEDHVEGSDLFSQKDILSFDLDPKGRDIITTSEDKNIRVWAISDVNLKTKMYLGIFGNKVLTAFGSLCVVLDKQSKALKIIDFEESVEKMTNRNVLDFCLGKDLKTLYLVKTNNSGHHVEIIDLVHLKSKKSFQIKQSLNYQDIDVSLNDSERYLILRIKVKDEEYAEIQASWRKQGGGFLPQSHHYRFYAIDLTQAAGGLMPCYRRLTKIPHLGEVICPFKGNVMMVTTRRWVLFWDIPTGKCDQRVTKGDKRGYMYRPDHIAKDVTGTTLALEQSKDGQYVVAGSEDGYLLVWEANTGFLVDRKNPKKRHTASVEKICITPDSKWAASYCLNNVLKLWDLSTATEVCSMKILSDVQSMKFSADSQYLVIHAGLHDTRLLVYKVHTGDA